jgi:hypothetical protein
MNKDTILSICSNGLDFKIICLTDKNLDEIQKEEWIEACVEISSSQFNLRKKLNINSIDLEAIKEIKTDLFSPQNSFSLSNLEQDFKIDRISDSLSGYEIKIEIKEIGFYNWNFVTNIQITEQSIITF